MDIFTINFIDGDISEKEFIKYLNSELLNEGFVDSIKSIFKSFKEKVSDIFYTFLVKAYQLGYDIFDKVSIFIKWLFNSISSFKEKNPTLYKVIIITSIVLVLLIVSASSAHAQSVGKPVDTNKINTAIGWLDYIKSTGKADSMQVNKAIAHLIDLKDGVIDIPSIGKDAINMADSSLKTVDVMIKQVKDTGDTTVMKMCLQLMEKGSSYLSASYTKSGMGEVIKLAVR